MNTLQAHSLAIFFDIDGTLIDSNGAGGSALLEALRCEFDLKEVSPVLLHGRTDLGIMTELLESHRISATAETLDRLSRRYFAILPAELVKRSGRILPGVERVLAMVAAMGDCHVGLLTGNMPASARMKLEHFGLWDYFQFGIFGDEAHHRPLLSEPALIAIRNRSGQEVPAERMIVVGDTPLDIELAKAMGARSLAVCTGGFDSASLLAAGACRVVEDLSQTESIMSWFYNQMELN